MTYLPQTMEQEGRVLHVWPRRAGSGAPYAAGPVSRGGRPRARRGDGRISPLDLLADQIADTSPLLPGGVYQARVLPVTAPTYQKLTTTGSCSGHHQDGPCRGS